MTACEIWLRRDYLLAHGIQPTEPECGHDPADCPPLALVGGRHAEPEPTTTDGDH